MRKPIWALPVAIDEINRRGKNTLSDHLGIEFTEIGDDFLRGRVPVDALRRTIASTKTQKSALASTSISTTSAPSGQGL